MSQQRDNKTYTNSNTYFSLQGRGPTYVLKEHRNQTKRLVNNFKKSLKAIHPLLSFQFHLILTEIENKAFGIKAKFDTSREVDIESIKSEFRELFTLKFCGNAANQEKLLSVFELVATRARNECIYEDDLITGIDFKHMFWLPNKGPHAKFVLQAIKIVFLHIVIPLFHSLWTPVVRKYYDVQFLPAKRWREVKLQLYRILKKMGFIERDHCADVQQLYVGKLHFIPKADIGAKFSLQSFRIVGRSRSNKELKQYNSLVIAKARHLTFVRASGFYKLWTKFRTTYSRCRLFGIKVDLVNCFESVDLHKLKELLNKDKLHPKVKNTLLQAIDHQHVQYFASTGKEKRPVYNWKKGLLQGLMFSNSLCEYYLAHVEVEKFAELNHSHIFIYRTVDDYLCVSTSPRDVAKFYSLAQSAFFLNKSKTQSNALRELKCTETVSFCGMDINLGNGVIKCMFDRSVPLYKRMGLWNLKRHVNRHTNLANASDLKRNSFFFKLEFMDINRQGLHRVENRFFESTFYVALKMKVAITSFWRNRFNECSSIQVYRIILKMNKRHVKHVLRKQSINDASEKKHRYMKLLAASIYSTRLVFRNCNNPLFDQLVIHLDDLIASLKPNHDGRPRRLYSAYKFNQPPLQLQNVGISREFNVIQKL